MPGRFAFLLVTLLLAAPASRGQTPAPAPVDPPPVDEAALANRLLEMTQPARGERAIIVHDPTYYPGITTRLREALHARGVQTYAIVEDTPAMIASYLDNRQEAERREADIIATWLPVFKASDIFYWMPSRGYGDDLRWEYLVARSRVRSVHFHWMLRFPGTRSAAEITETSRTNERRSLDVDLADHAARQRRLAEALRGRTLRITTPAGTDLSVRVPRDQWFHLGDGDASKARAATARSVRDRQMELPVGMFVMVPEAAGVNGTLAAPAISQSGGEVDRAVFTLTRGRATAVRATKGERWIRDRIADIGPDGGVIASIFVNTNPVLPMPGLVIDVGSNWENGGRNRATRMRRMTIRLPDATVTVDGRTIMRDGRLEDEAR